ncbi:hypothetical protein Tco_0327027 [Tanacetum coccineum]
MAFGDASNPLDVDSDPDIHGKFLASYASYVIAHVTPPSRKQHLKEISLEKLYDIYDRAYMRQAILDNMLNSRTRKLMSTLLKVRASCGAIWEMEIKKDNAYAELEKKCNDALLVLKEKKWVNYEQTLVILRSKVKGLESEREKLKSSKTELLQEIDGLRQDRATVVAKVVPHVATKLVATLKEPFDLEKMSGYRPSSKKEFDQAGDDLATASYPFLAKPTDDPYASLEVLLSKKLKSLGAKHAPSTSKPSSSKAPKPIS